MFDSLILYDEIVQEVLCVVVGCVFGLVVEVGGLFGDYYFYIIFKI